MRPVPVLVRERWFRGWILGLCAIAMLAIGVEPVRAGSSGRDDATPTSYFSCTLGGRPCGMMSERIETLPDGGIRSTIELRISFVRSGVAVATSIEASVTLDADGGLSAMSHGQASGDAATRTQWTFERDHVVERRTQSGRTVDARRPRPEGDWVVSESAIETARRLGAGGLGRRLLVLDPAHGLQPVARTYRLRGDETLALSQGPVATEAWEIEEEDGTVTIEHLDRNGRLVASETSLGPGLGALRVERTTESLARRAAAGSFPLTDIGTVVPTFESGARRLDRSVAARYRVVRRQGAEPLDLPGIASQSVTPSSDPPGLVVEVDPERTSAIGATFERAAHLEATGLLDADDPEVRAFARRHDRRGRPDGERARALRTAVHRHIRDKNLETGFGTASDAVRSRSGDCTEHAVLLAAALRAVGIPSRTVSGLVWVPGDDPRGSFQWHMWTQAVIDGRWLDLDPTLGGRRAFHGGHIAVMVGDDGEWNQEAGSRAMLDLIGAIDIEVLAADPAGERP